jgi:predicted enzyme related to lactoylglutathione lyase
MRNSNGRFIWHELMTTDVDAAVTFYTKVVGWSAEPFGDTSYTMLVNDGVAIAGVVAVDSGHASRGAPRWLPSVCVYDVDACARQVATIGGRLRYGPTEVPGIGAWAVIADTEGAELGLYEPVGPDAPQGKGEGRGDFSWHELGATNYKTTFEFYHALFQWSMLQEADMGPMGVYAMFGPAGARQPFGGMFNKTATMPGSGWLSYVEVPDATASVDAVKAAGGTVVHGPTEVPGGHIAVCADPQGVSFAFHAPATGGH